MLEFTSRLGSIGKVELEVAYLLQQVLIFCSQLRLGAFGIDQKILDLRGSEIYKPEIGRKSKRVSKRTLINSSLVSLCSCRVWNLWTKSIILMDMEYLVDAVLGLFRYKSCLVLGGICSRGLQFDVGLRGSRLALLQRLFGNGMKWGWVGNG